jgi:D-arabinose 1-dehydrogenase-like Zn-dependent alcohol dehydrogenase
MAIASAPKAATSAAYPSSMRAAVFHGPNDIRVEEVARPHPGPGEAVIRITLTTICGTDAIS